MTAQKEKISPHIKRGVMGACEYSQSVLKDLKNQLMDIGNPKNNVAWAIGSVLITLVAHLIKNFLEILDENKLKEKPNALEDLEEVRKRFNDFIDKMISDAKD